MSLKLLNLRYLFPALGFRFQKLLLMKRQLVQRCFLHQLALQHLAELFVKVPLNLPIWDDFVTTASCGLQG